MITNKDRSGWFGASDTKFIVGNYDTKTFLKWWLTKLGLSENNFSNKYTEAGTAYEHRIARFIEEIENHLKDPAYDEVKAKYSETLENTRNSIEEVLNGSI